jgi:hypothetical protein
MSVTSQHYQNLISGSSENDDEMQQIIMNSSPAVDDN